MNRRIFTSLVMVSTLLFVATTAFAKRAPPAEVAPVRQGDLEYRVRHHTGREYLPGFVEAWDTSKNGLVWHRQIYVIRRNPDLEGDIQDVFITGMKLLPDRNVLEITNEAGGVFELNLETLAVKVLKGQAVLPAK
jgi:hypothetical protein